MSNEKNVSEDQLAEVNGGILILVGSRDKRPINQFVVYSRKGLAEQRRSYRKVRRRKRWGFIPCAKEEEETNAP